jgi:hypothetical protein
MQIAVGLDISLHTGAILLEFVCKAAKNQLLTGFEIRKNGLRKAEKEASGRPAAGSRIPAQNARDVAKILMNLNFRFSI